MSSGWLEPARRALDAREQPLELFLRDDDAGWADARLAMLLDACARHRLPIDVAVIPSELTDRRAAWLSERRRTHTARLGLHQHGWAHTNHEVSGRKCEFGASRSLEDLRTDLARGRVRMLQALGADVDPVFTPPWNRCVDAIGPMLLELGIEVLSRDVTAKAMGIAGLRECPVHIDWSGKRKGIRFTADELAANCASAFSSHAVAGVLFHHAVMDESEIAIADELLELLSAHPMVHAVSLREAAAPPSPRPVVAAAAAEALA